jgi:AcrR family transcriptional regulator
MENNLSRRDREKQLRRREMLQAARAVFAEKGFTHATLDEIAQRAEFGKGTLYNYFEGKADILYAIFDEFYDDFIHLLETAFSSENRADRSFRDVFRGFLESTFGFFLGHQDMFMLMMKVAHRMVFSEQPDQAAYFNQQRNRLIDSLIVHLEEAMASGEMRRLPSSAVAHMIFGNINGFLMHLTLDGQEAACGNVENFTPKEAADFLASVLLDGLLPHRDGVVSTQHGQLVA